jgi:hypothetical protein
MLWVWHAERCFCHSQEKLRPIDRKLAYQVEKLLAAGQRAPADGADGAAADPLSFGPRPEALVPRAAAGNAADPADAGRRVICACNQCVLDLATSHMLFLTAGGSWPMGMQAQRMPSPFGLKGSVWLRLLFVRWQVCTGRRGWQWRPWRTTQTGGSLPRSAAASARPPAAAAALRWWVAPPLLVPQICSAFYLVLAKTA